MSLSPAKEHGIPLDMRFELLVALRYLAAKRKAGVSATGFLTVAGVALGVSALTIVTSVWNGFEAEFLDKALGVNAHSTVLRRGEVFRDHRSVSEKLQGEEGIELVAAFTYQEVILQGPNGAQGVVIKGIDPEQASMLPIARYVDEMASTFDTLDMQGPASPSSDGAAGIILGDALLEKLRVKEGQFVSMISPYGGSGGEATTGTFQVVGRFHSGMYEFDARLAIISLAEAQRFFRLHGAVTGVEVWTDEPMTSYITTRLALERLYPNDPLAFDIRDWSVSNAGIFGAVRSQKSLISLFLFFIVIVAAFNILATLMLLILEKSREIAVLKSMGSSRASILTIFVIDGQLVGVIGCVAGILIGLAACALLQQYGLRLDPRVYYLEQLPIVVRPAEIAVVAAGAMVLSTLATVFPALRAANTSTIEGLTQRARGTR